MKQSASRERQSNARKQNTHGDRQTQHRRMITPNSCTTLARNNLKNPDKIESRAIIANGPRKCKNVFSVQFSSVHLLKPASSPHNTNYKQLRLQGGEARVGRLSRGCHKRASRPPLLDAAQPWRAVEPALGSCRSEVRTVMSRRVHRALRPGSGASLTNQACDSTRCVTGCHSPRARSSPWLSARITLSKVRSLAVKL